MGSYTNGGGGTRTHIRLRAPVFKTGSLAIRTPLQGSGKDGERSSWDQRRVGAGLGRWGPGGPKTLVHLLCHPYHLVVFFDSRGSIPLSGAAEAVRESPSET
jgi:hypothetical protein